MRRPHAALFLVLVASASCSSKADDPVVAYPPGAAPGEGPPPPATASGPAKPSTPSVDSPRNGQELLDHPVTIEDVTTDGDLVFIDGADLDVLPVKATTPTVVVRDYDSGHDELLVRGRLVGAWVGDDPRPSAITSWTAASGVKVNGPVAARLALYPKAGSETFAYGGSTPSLLSSHLWVTQAGGGGGTRVVTNLDSGLTNEACKPAITWAASELLVAGCPNGTTMPRIALYAVDGSGSSKTILEGSAPGVWVNHARTHALVQTSSAADLRSLSSAPAPLAIDTPVVQAAFSRDDSKLLYRRADGKVRRASTTAPGVPLDLGTSIGMLGYSPDARFVVYATKRDPSTKRTTLVVVDASAPGAPVVAAQENAAYFGMTSDGAAVLFQIAVDGSSKEPLIVLRTDGGAPVTITADARRVVFDGEVVYWQELDAATKTNVLKAARLSAPGTVMDVDRGLDAFTSTVVRAGDRLYVGSKLGLRMYPAIKP